MYCYFGRYENFDLTMENVVRMNVNANVTWKTYVDDTVRFDCGGLCIYESVVSVFVIESKLSN